MIPEISLFVTITSLVGLVNVILAQPLEKSPGREFVSYLGVVVGGIATFTAIIVLVSIWFQ